MSSPELSVSVRDLDAAGKAFHFTLRAAWIRSAVEDTDVTGTERDGELDVRLSKSGHDVVVRGTLTAELVLPCARCLEPAHVAIREPLSALFVPGGRASDSSDSADVIAYDGETVVLDGLVRDEMLLALPIVPLCSESCAGIRLPQT